MAKEFGEKFKELQDKFDKSGRFLCDNDGLIQFVNYARHYFMSDCKQLIEDNLDSIEEGRLWFNCDDEDGCVLNY